MLLGFACFFIFCGLLILFGDSPTPRIGFFFLYLGLSFVVIHFVREHDKKKSEKRKALEEEKAIEEDKAIEEKLLLISSNIFEEINKCFLISKCSKCNEINYELIQFNTQLDTIKCKCISCNKIYWIKAEQRISESIYNEYIEYCELTFNIKPIILISNYNIENYSKDRHHIPSSVKDKVWNRDGGKCVKCGSQKNLEFDHIIPVSKGGSNTARNIQLLCEKCNRSKGSKIV